MSESVILRFLARPVEKISRIIPNPVGSVMFFVLLLPFAAFYPLYYLRMDTDTRSDTAYFAAVQKIPGISQSRLVISVIVSLIYFVILIGLVTMMMMPHLYAQLNASFRNILSSLSVIDLVAVGVGASFPALLCIMLIVAVNLHLWGSEKDLTVRLTLSVVIGFVFGGLLTFLDWRAGLSIGLFGFYAGLSTNGYIVKTDDVIDTRASNYPNSNTKSIIDPEEGEEVADSVGEDLVERIEPNWDAPDDLYAQSNVISALAYKPLRIIHRSLFIDESKIRKEVPRPAFSDKKETLRTDVRSRDENAPDGFNDETYRYLIPGSIDSHQCSECTGKGQVTCRDCGGGGEHQCNRCNGRQVEVCANCGTSGELLCAKCDGGKHQCPKCNGSQVIRKKVECGSCRGSGETEQGFECQVCGGRGTVEETRPCSCDNGQVTCSKCRGTGKVPCHVCSGTAGSPCKKCNGTGTVDCRTCSATGVIVCEHCEGSGQRVEYKVLKRTYQHQEKSKYKTKSIPEKLINTAQGERVDLETNNEPDPETLFRKQVEVQAIPVVATIYTYAGQTWEAFMIDDTLRTLEYPRDYESQFGVVSGLAVLTLLALAIPYIPFIV